MILRRRSVLLVDMSLPVFFQIQIFYVSRFTADQDGPGSLMDVCQGGVDDFYGGLGDYNVNEQRPIYGIDSRQAGVRPAVSSVDVLLEPNGDNSGRNNVDVDSFYIHHVRKAFDDSSEDTGLSESKPGAIRQLSSSACPHRDQQPMAEMSTHANAESRSNQEQLLPSGDQCYGRFNPRTTRSNGST